MAEPKPIIPNKDNNAKIRKMEIEMPAHVLTIILVRFPETIKPFIPLNFGISTI